MTVTIVVVCVGSGVCVCMCCLLMLFPEHQGSVIGACGCVRYKYLASKHPETNLFILSVWWVFCLFVFYPRPAVGNPIQSKGR